MFLVKVENIIQILISSIAQNNLNKMYHAKAATMELKLFILRSTKKSLIFFYAWQSSLVSAIFTIKQPKISTILREKFTHLPLLQSTSNLCKILYKLCSIKLKGHLMVKKLMTVGLVGLF